MNLDAWTIRLVAHFGELAKQRRDRGLGVFALEHGLSLDEREVFEREIRAAALAGEIKDKHWLSWVAYAAERGYEYSGDEYWQSFEEATPRWRTDGKRDWVRDWFERFAREYGGVWPAGAWARHFTIISWPITHAILPRDLQRYLAQILYRLRHSFSSAVLQDAEALGALIQARSWDASSRFRHLAQHKRLMGQIATALLRPDDNNSRYQILPGTLQRIGQDLDRERRTRHWLSHAQVSARERFQLKGLQRTVSGRLWDRPEEGLSRDLVEALGMEPRLLLRPQGSDVWHVFLEFPDLSHLRERCPELGRVLSESRCFVAGATGSHVPRGGFLYGSRRVRLERWPGPGEHLLRFEATSAETTWLQSAETLLRPGPWWLTKISADGLTRECRSQICHPGSSYIACSTLPLGELGFGRRIKLACSGIQALRIDLPDVVDRALEGSLKQAGFMTTRRLEVWPAGVPAALWDEDGYGEWVVSQPICIGVRTDHDVDRLEVESLAQVGKSVTLKPAPGEVSFLSLALDSPGLHRICVSAYSCKHVDPEVGDLVVKVRSPREPSLHTNSGAPIWIEKRPPSPTMEEIWKGEAVVFVHGPPGLHIRVTLGLWDGLSSRSFKWALKEPISLPLEAKEWSGILAAFCQEPKSREFYDTAQALSMDLDAGLFGHEQLVFEREVSPLRWILRAKRLQLFDDTGNRENVQVWKYDFAHPTVRETVPIELVVQGTEAPQNGGLFLATSKDLERGVVVAPTSPLKGLRALKANPVIDLPARSVSGLHFLTEMAVCWSSARLSGDLLSTIRRNEVLACLLQRIFGLIGGPRWEQGEAKFQRQEIVLESLAHLVGRHTTGNHFAEGLLEAVPGMAQVSTQERVSIFREITLRTLSLQPGEQLSCRGGSLSCQGVETHGFGGDFVESCLRLATLAHGLKGWGGAYRDKVADWVLKNPDVTRGARLVVLGVDELLGAGASMERPHSGWEW